MTGVCLLFVVSVGRDFALGEGLLCCCVAATSSMADGGVCKSVTACWLYRSGSSFLLGFTTSKRSEEEVAVDRFIVSHPNYNGCGALIGHRYLQYLPYFVDFHF